MARARAAAIRAAAREHARLGTDLTRRIDIFGIIEQAGIWLMFQPLRELYGVFFRQGDVCGILLNAAHPVNLQRFTAAHEYAHFALGHGPTLDREAHIQGPGQRLAVREVAAQTFAAWFLMPPRLVNVAIGEQGLLEAPGPLAAQGAYRLSLAMGASYAATVTQLGLLGKISPEVALSLRRVAPNRIKAQLARSRRTANPRADVWIAGPGERAQSIHPFVGDEIHLFLPETPSSGYRWTNCVVEEPPGVSAEHCGPQARALLERVEDAFESRSWNVPAFRVGGAGDRHFVFRVARDGRASLVATNRRLWEQSGAAADSFELQLEAFGPRAGSCNRGISAQQRARLAAC